MHKWCISGRILPALICRHIWRRRGSRGFPGSPTHQWHSPRDDHRTECRRPRFSWRRAERTRRSSRRTVDRCSTGWWLSPTPLKNDGVKVSWDHYSQYMDKKTMFQTTNQSMYRIFTYKTGQFLECRSIFQHHRASGDAKVGQWLVNDSDEKMKKHGVVPEYLECTVMALYQL